MQWHILPTLNNRKYGFVPQRGIEDALCNLVTYLREEREKNNSNLLVSLDIEGTFDNEWWPAIKKQPAFRKRCPRNLCHIVDSYLRDRRVVVKFTRRESDEGKGDDQELRPRINRWTDLLERHPEFTAIRRRSPRPSVRGRCGSGFLW
ncbi:hypothetical protein EVAR_30663_1 [Eumeta japonica]|uniref:Uncharacterized protein n=1 Tax=Eumeta variegata TaxID=151549 RepID=A0A4C1VTT2_EUMVA|nr:hypothetical protein EVAR_30663_1 [Eumeta japonica]